MPQELDVVQLLRAQPEHGLAKGATGTIVFLYSKDACEVEFIISDRESVVLTLGFSDIESVESAGK